MGMRRAIALLAAMLVGGSAAPAQQKEPAVSASTLPAETLAFAEEMEKQSSAKLLDWARKQARGMLRGEVSTNLLSPESMTKQFPSEAASTHEAVRFLVVFQIYRRSSGQLEAHAATVSDWDREINDLEHEMRLLESTGVPIPAARAREDELAARQNRLDELRRRRNAAAKDEQIERRRVDSTLRWLSEAHGRLKDTPPDVLRSLRPPRT